MRGPLRFCMCAYFILPTHSYTVRSIAIKIYVTRALVTETTPKSEKCGGHSWLRTSNMPPERHSPQDPAFPMVQPMRASLYFDDIVGFGEWSILLSTRAQKYLRDVKRADGAMFRAVMKKIK